MNNIEQMLKELKRSKLYERSTEDDMLEEAIELMEKQKYLYIIQNRNIITKPKKKALDNQVKEEIKKEIRLREYILKILREKEKEYGSTKDI
ncbi:MAG: hypothetical protein IJ272_04595 [Clostridia bacterium]|nr:hypothetical protein [Clostridia bacterium]